MRNIILAACVIAASSTVGQAQSVVLVPSSDPSLALGGFGQNGVPTVGESFTIGGTANYLTDFHFYLGNDAFAGGGDQLKFQPYLMSWNGSSATGNNLLMVSPTTIGNGATDGSFRDYLFTAGIPVTPGAMYVAFLSASGVAQSGNGLGSFIGSETPYTGGQLVYAFTDNTAPDFTAPDVWNDGAGANLAFKADITTTPEPSEFVLLASGLSGLAGLARLRRRHATRA